jgi:hypothetical protein
VLVALASLAAPPARADDGPRSAAETARDWVRDWTLHNPSRVCSQVEHRLQVQLALASGPGTCAGAVASALAARPDDAKWEGASVLRERVRLVSDRLAEVTFTLRHELRSAGRSTSSLRRDRIYLVRPDARTGQPWRVASLGVLPFIVSGSANVALDPVVLDPPAVLGRVGLPAPVPPLTPTCTGQVQGARDVDQAGDVRRAVPQPRAAGQLLPAHPRGPEFGTITAETPFAFTGATTNAPWLDLRSLRMFRETDGRVCLQVRFAARPRPDMRLLVRWFEPVPGSNTEGVAGSVEVRIDGRGGLHYWFDQAKTTVADPDFSPRYEGRVPEVGVSGDFMSIRLSAEDLNNPERFRIALRSASSLVSDPAGPSTLAAGDTIGATTSGVEWPSGLEAPLFDPGTGQ